MALLIAPCGGLPIYAPPGVSTDGIYMDIRSFELVGPLEITPRLLGDARGYFAEVWRDDHFTPLAGMFDFVQENQSHSAQVGTIRGLHFQTPPAAQGKLVRCVKGAIFDVAVDIRHGSPTFGQWIGVELTAQRLNQLWVPPGFAHGFCTLAPDTIVSYKVTNYYSPDHDKGLRWNDPALGIVWPDMADAQTLSVKDRIQPMLHELTPQFCDEGAITCA
jgi:dTDP-4-dehydrorhamnose 3,5-epimerase